MLGLATRREDSCLHKGWSIPCKRIRWFAPALDSYTLRKRRVCVCVFPRQTLDLCSVRNKSDDPMRAMKRTKPGKADPWLLLGNIFHIFAYCGLVVEIHLTARI